jgi:hypothetical protein
VDMRIGQLRYGEVPVVSGVEVAVTR